MNNPDNALFEWVKYLVKDSDCISAVVSIYVGGDEDSVFICDAKASFPENNPTVIHLTGGIGSKPGTRMAFTYAVKIEDFAHATYDDKGRMLLPAYNLNLTASVGTIAVGFFKTPRRA